jgi:pyruvate dehydrogenase E1 component alpha subunit
VIIDGFDVMSLYDEFKPLVDRCREDQRPAFVDLKTYRYLGHSMSDPQKYRTKDEVDQFKQKDSIDRLASYLMNAESDRARRNNGRPALSEQQFMEVQSEVKEAVRKAMEFAESSPVPDPAQELYSDVMLSPMPNMSPTREYVQGAKNPLL